MKKRILSILLAVLMIVPMFTFATTVSAADETTWYSYDFEDRDIRNYAAGQVLDLGVVGEAAVEPKLDGEIGDDEYQHQTTFPRHSNVAKAPANMPVWYAVKGEYLYVAFANFAEEKRQTIQYEMTVMGNHMSYQAYNRISAQVTAAGTLAGGSTTFGLPSLSGYVSGSTGYYPSNFIKGWAWSDGVYEVKMDIGYVYRLFAGSPSHDGVWESPVIGFFFWYDVDEKGGVGQTQYAYTVPSVKIDCERTVGWVPKSIILPKTTHESVQQYKYQIGEFGYDSRNSADTQLATLNGEVAVAPVQDGVINSGEYSTTQVHKQTYHAGYGDLTASYAVKNGYLYAGFQYASVESKNCIVQYGFTGADGATHISRSAQTVKTDSTVANQNYIYKDAANMNAWTSVQFGAALGNTYGQCIDAAKYAFNDGIITIEIRVSLPQLAGAFEDAGWSADNANAVYFMLFPDSSKQMAFGINSATITQIQKTTGIAYHAGYVLPTVKLPEGYAAIYDVKDVDDLEAFGQYHGNASVSVVNLDGKIGAGEYTASQSYNALRSSDGKAQPDIDNVNGTNYFAYDAEYIYVGAKVYDPNYKSGKSAYQFNISVLNKKDRKVDLGDGVTRVNMMANVYDNGTYNAPTYSGVYRSNNWVFKEDGKTMDYRVGEAEFAAAYKAAVGPKFAGSYDADTKTITYEFAIKIADLKTIFGVDEVESFNFLNYVVYGTGVSGWNLFKTNDVARSNLALKGRTASGNKGLLNYTNDFYGHVVHLDGDAQTRQSASARISNTAAGLRFKSHFTNEYLAYMANYAEAKGETMEIGTLIAPADYIKGEFTHAALGAGNYVEVMADLNTPFSNANGVTTIAGSLVNIKEANLDRDFAGIGFIKIGNEYFYTDNYTVKNVSDIASAALADTKAVAGNGYDYKVSEGVYSPYSEGQRNVLNTLIAK